MGLLDDIVLSPSEVLATECEPIQTIDRDVKKLADRMLKIMYAAEGCGLAAPQVGVTKQLVVIDCDYEGRGSKKNPYVLINPKVVTADGEMRDFQEGCLSFPGISVTVTRPSHVVVQAYDLNGDLLQYEAEGNLMAVCLQHEIDHLNGRTMFEAAGPRERIQALQDYEYALSHGARPGDTESE